MRRRLVMRNGPDWSPATHYRRLAGSALPLDHSTSSHTGAADRRTLIFGRNEIHMLNDDRGEAGLAFFELNAELSIDRFGERKGTILECFRRFG